MKIALVGPELEENLALRYIHASLVKAGHDCRIYDFHEELQIAPVAAGLSEWGPQIVGMSMVFTARARQYAQLAQRLREIGHSGHITAGGHFASFHAEQILTDAPAFSSVLHGEGEQALVDLAAHLDQLDAVTGIVFRDAAGKIVETAARPALEDLDQLPWPSRMDRFDAYLGLPIANILSSRGCFGHCSFCSIQAWHGRIGGSRLRQRSVEDLTAEMAHLYHDCGVRIFNFHDDNFFVSDLQANLQRFHAIRDQLKAKRVGRIAIQIKARPDSINAEVVEALKEIGLFRVFLGVESNAVAGLKALGGGIKRQQNHEALELLKSAGLHVTFNLLMFEPDCSMQDLHDNIDYIEASADTPLNFCRVEVYGGTPIHNRLARQGRLIGDYWGYTYKIADDSVQRAYETFREVFTPRNFVLGGANLRAMAVDYNLHVLKRFFPRRHTAGLADRCRASIARLNTNNVELLREVCSANVLAKSGDIEAHVGDLSQRRQEFDRKINREFTGLLTQMQQCAHPAGQKYAMRAASVAAAAVLVTVMGCKRTEPTQVCEMAPPNMLTSAPTTAAAAYDPAEAENLAWHFYANYLETVEEWETKSGHRTCITIIELDLAADGSVLQAKITHSNVDPSKYGILEALARRWVGPKPTRAGSLPVIFNNSPTQVCEMAPPDTQPMKRAPRDWTHPSEMVPAPDSDR